ncbi:MAG: F420-dependent methylenetetrahydromethanopterin dehydrogenase [Candidatus Wukongarchaeota archaeon]|nr:F420-dependent methylenetetrahydromethanopterin dehydrogenase [Candidatus Wukongarchaeota archaeon]
MSEGKEVRLGILKIGAIGTAVMLEYLLDERADRKDLITRVVTSGSKMGPEHAEEVAPKLLEFNPDVVVIVSPNAALPGPSKGREIVAQCKVPTIVITDAPGAKAEEDCQAKGMTLIVMQGDSMIGAKREFLDPAEVAMFNGNLLLVLGATGALNIVVSEIDSALDAAKSGGTYEPSVIKVKGEKAVAAANFTNPYAHAKAHAAYQIATGVAAVTTTGCFKMKEPEKYIPTVAAGHEMMQEAARLALEARELEKGNDTLVRMPHFKQGEIMKKTKLLEKPELK